MNMLPRGLHQPDGEVAEWLKAHAWKACIRETVSRDRIPLSPPLHSELISLCPAGSAYSASVGTARDQSSVPVDWARASESFSDRLFSPDLSTCCEKVLRSDC